MDEEIKMKSILDSFDSSLNIIKHIKTMTKDQLTHVLVKVTKEIDTEDFVVDIERPRTWNAAAFLSAILNEYDEALIYARNSSVQYAQNINSKIIQAFCHLRRAEFFESRQICDELEELRANKMEVLLAKSEMAFMYSRLGIDMFELAENAYKEVCQQCKDATDVPVRYVCMWKFGRALAMNRTLNIHNLHKYKRYSCTTERIETIVRLFIEVAETEDDTVAKYVARACVELGLLVSTKKGQLKGIFLPGAQYKAEYYFVKALKLCPNDVFVLERSGKYYRYNDDIQQSIELLSKAISIRSTSFGHHHLALSLKRKLEKLSPEWTNYRTHVFTQAQHHVRPLSGMGFRPNFRGRHKDHRVTNECSTQEARTAKSGSGFPYVNAKDIRKGNTAQHRQDNQRDRATNFNVKSMIKSPKKIKYLEPDETTDKIMFHLDEAYALADNVGALYDKGLMLRQLKKADKALVIFKKIICNERISLMQLANSYEQAAFCLIDDETADEDPDIVKKRQYNITMYLKLSIEIGFTMVANIPLLCDAWESLPTLKNILCNQVETTETLNELAFVHEKMKHYKDAIGCYKQIVELEESENKKIEVHLKIVENYLIIRDYDEAVLCLDMIMCLPEVLYKINPELYLSTYIEGGIDAVKRGETNIAGLRLRKALDYSKTLATVTNKEAISLGEFDTTIDNEGFDIYIHCDVSVEDKWRPLKDILIHAGLQATLNSDDNTPGAVELWGMLGNLETSTHCIIIAECNETTLTSHAQVFVDQVLRDRAKKRHSNVVVVLEEDSKEVTSKLTMFRSVVFRPDGEYTATCELSQDTLDELKKLMYQLATPSKCETGTDPTT